MSDLEVAARKLLDEVSSMLAWYADHEPDRLRRRGVQNVLYAAGDLEAVLEGQTLSDPSQNAIGAFSADSSDTSRNAAIDVYPRTGTQRLAVLEQIARSIDGLTDEEVRDRLDIRYSSECARRKELVDGGWIKDSGFRRLTSTGNEAIVWVLTDKARSEMAHAVEAVS